MTEAVQKKRLDYIDVLRAAGIILMIMGHVGFGGKFDRYIHTFHMPVFFLISGFLYKAKSDIPLVKQIWKRTVRLLLPYAVYALINYLFWLLLEWDRFSNPFEILLNLVTYNTQNLPIAGALWFLTALFWCEMFYLLLDRLLAAKPNLRTAVVLAIAVLASFLQNAVSFRLPLSLDTGIVCMGFYELGRRFRGVEDRFKEWFLKRKTVLRLVIFCLTLLVNAGLAFVNDYVNVKSGWYGFVPLFWFNAVLGSFMLYLAAGWFDRVIAEGNIFRIVVIRTGRASIVFMCLNQLVILLLELAAESIHISETLYLRSIIIFVVTMPILYIVSVLLNKITNKKVRTMFGL